MNIEETMWGRVEYELDKQKADVPLSFFKDYEVVLSELQSCVLRSEYKVFWSIKQEDTPKTVLQEQGQILDIEKIVRGKKNVPLTGYYKAKLLHYAESLSDLIALCEKPKGRRPVQPTMKTECKENKKMTGKSKTMSNCIEEARQYNLQRLINDDRCDQSKEKRKLKNKEIKDDNKEAKLPNTICSFRELSKEDNLTSMDYALDDDHEEKIIKKQKTISDNTEHRMPLQEELKEWKQKYTKLDIKYKDLKDRYFKVLDLNVKWQEKELSHHSSHRSSHKSESSKHKSAKHDSCNKSKDSLKRDNNSNLLKSDELPCSSGILEHQKVKTQLPQWQNDFDGSDIILNENLPVIDIDSGVTVLHVEQATPQISIVDTSLSSTPKSQHIIQLKDSDHVSHVADDIEKELHNNKTNEIRPQLDEGATANKNYTLESPAYNIDPPNGVSAVSQAQFDQINKVELGLKGDGKFVKRIADML